MAPSRMTRTVHSAAPATHPQMDCGEVAGEQLEMTLTDGKTYPQRISEVYGALQVAVDRMGGVVAFAALLEKPTSEVSRRANRADDGKGTRMQAFLDYVAFLDDEAFGAFHDALGAARGRLPAERSRRLRPEERAGHLRELVSDKAVRAKEKELGLPVGSLDR